MHLTHQTFRQQIAALGIVAGALMAGLGPAALLIGEVTGIYLNYRSGENEVTAIILILIGLGFSTDRKSEALRAIRIFAISFPFFTCLIAREYCNQGMCYGPLLYIAWSAGILGIAAIVFALVAEDRERKRRVGQKCPEG